MTYATAPGQSASECLMHVIQGTHLVSDDPAVVMTTILGSCVATCLWDPVARVGGMNHFLLAKEPESGAANHRYGSHAMELLINDLLKTGALRSRLKAKLFGGAMMQNSFGKIGRANSEFALQFLADEDIPIVSQSLLGTQARRIRFSPVDGQAQQRLVAETDIPPIHLPKPPATDDITFF
ncbi:MAG: chemotaxis protein CheD [Alphaproteobacteria bacterium]|nr:chemotaxis protein CheD [Alphaproteobacteria bacterium]